jgi:AcrR family transcriptional regulator
MTLKEPPPPTSTGSRPRGRRGRATHDRLVRAVGELLETTSYRDLGIAVIARHAGTSPATFYHYFPDLGSAVEELAHTMLQQGEQLAALVEGGDWEGKPLHAAYDLTDAFVDFWEAHRSVIRVVELLAEEGDRRFQRIRQQILLDLTKALARAIDTHGTPASPEPRPSSFAGALTLTSMLSHVATYRRELPYWSVDAGDARAYLAEIICWVVTRRDPALEPRP